MYLIKSYQKIFESWLKLMARTLENVHIILFVSEGIRTKRNGIARFPMSRKKVSRLFPSYLKLGTYYMLKVIKINPAISQRFADLILPV